MRETFMDHGFVHNIVFKLCIVLITKINYKFTQYKNQLHTHTNLKKGKH